ncbi:MAG: hypothetical protein ACRD2U_18100 [Terriglobales bacterium]
MSWLVVHRDKLAQRLLVAKAHDVADLGYDHHRPTSNVILSEVDELARESIPAVERSLFDGQILDEDGTPEPC